METVILDEEQNSVTFSCPWCKMMISVDLRQLNCKIFRCGIYKDSLRQINPHMPKDECDELVQSQRIYGCSRPFKYIAEDPPKVIKCDYI